MVGVFFPLQHQLARSVSWGAGEHEDLVLFCLCFSVPRSHSPPYHVSHKYLTFITKFPPTGKTGASIKGADVGRSWLLVWTERGDTHLQTSHP